MKRKKLTLAQKKALAQELYQQYPQVTEILHAVAEVMQLPEELIRSKCKEGNLPFARYHAVRQIKRKVEGLSKVKIGLMLGLRDHTTIIHAERSWEDTSMHDRKFREADSKISALVEERLPIFSNFQL